jgi:hypothetical protein
MAYNLNEIKKIKSEVMKKMKTYLAGLLLVIGLFGIAFNSNSQDTKPDKKSKKEAKKAQLTANFHVLDSLLSFRVFVLEADYLQNKYGSRIWVSSNLNFVRVDGPKSVLQTGSNFSEGSNGVGGVTAEGTIGNYKINRNTKNLTFTVTFNVLTQIGAFDIFLIVTADNNATATISGSTSGRLMWDGHIATLNNSRVFKGQNSI